jgi:agmatine deiminase
MNDDTPAALGYRMPAEWEHHEATWIAWPHNREDWPRKFGPIPWVYVEIVRLLSHAEQVNILVENAKAVRKISVQLERGGAELDRVRFLITRTDRVWTRDYAPCFVVKDEAEADHIDIVDWKFTGWAKYENHRRDNRVTRHVAELLGLKRWKPRADAEHGGGRIVLEGGAIDVNGRGTLITTEECLLSDVQARNPSLDRAAIEAAFHNYLGVTNVIWLNRGIVGDDTHGHVDDITRFVGPSTVVTAVESNRKDENHGPLQENLERLLDARDQDGKPLEVITLPMPSPVFFEGQRLPASYANFYIANGVVIVPTFNDPRDREALSVLAAVFPDRAVVGVHATDLVWGLGTLHCLTREQPATRLQPKS